MDMRTIIKRIIRVRYNFHHRKLVRMYQTRRCQAALVSCGGDGQVDKMDKCLSKAHLAHTPRDAAPRTAAEPRHRHAGHHPHKSVCAIACKGPLPAHCRLEASAQETSSLQGYKPQSSPDSPIIQVINSLHKAKFSLSLDESGRAT